MQEGEDLVETGTERERSMHEVDDLGMMRRGGRSGQILRRHCREDSTSQSYLGGHEVDGEGACVTILLDEVKGDEEVSFCQTQVAQGFPGSKVAEIADKEGDKASERSRSNLTRLLPLIGADL
jgi:hypothetical protein